MSVQEVLKLLRLELGMTQTDLAQKLNKAFITVNRWENGKGFPSRSNARDILAVAKRYNASDECISYLYDVLMPDVKRKSSASTYSFSDIDKDFLFQLADGSTNALYVIEAGTYKLLYINRKAKEMAEIYHEETGQELWDSKFNEKTGKRCFNYFASEEKPCPFCPLSKVEYSTNKDFIISIPRTRRRLKVHARATDMKGKKVYAMYLTDITQENAERNALYNLTNDIPFGVGIYHVYLNEKIELAFMNNILFQMIGEERKQAILQNNITGFCLVHQDDKGHLMQEIRESIVKKRDVDIDLRMRIRDEKYHNVNLKAKMIRRDKEKFTFYCIFNETDELKVIK